jgi:16S rRNA (cytosine967-C5)-methyltransferase
VILNEAKDLLKKNGYLYYITCSLLKIENEKVIQKFLMENKYFRLVDKKNVTIDNYGDGFFLRCIAKEKLKLILNFFVLTCKNKIRTL